MSMTTMEIQKKIVGVCLECGKVRQDGRWVVAGEVDLPPEGTAYSHGYCPDCFPLVLQATSEWIREYKLAHVGENERAIACEIGG